MSLPGEERTHATLEGITHRAAILVGLGTRARRVLEHDERPGDLVRHIAATGRCTRHDAPINRRLEPFPPALPDEIGLPGNDIAPAHPGLR